MNILRRLIWVIIAPLVVFSWFTVIIPILITAWILTGRNIGPSLGQWWNAVLHNVVTPQRGDEG